MKMIFSPLVLITFLSLIPTFNSSMTQALKTPLKNLQELCVTSILNNIDLFKKNNLSNRNLFLKVYKNFLFETENNKAIVQFIQRNISSPKPQPRDLHPETLIHYIKLAFSLDLEIEVRNEEKNLAKEVTQPSRSIRTRIKFFDLPVPCSSV